MLLSLINLIIHCHIQNLDIILIYMFSLRADQTSEDYVEAKPYEF